MKLDIKRYLDYLYGSHLIPFYVILIFSIVVAVVLNARLLDIKAYWIQQLLEVTANNAERNFQNQFDDLSDYMESVSTELQDQHFEDLQFQLNSIFNQYQSEIPFVQKIEVFSPQRFKYEIASISVDSTINFVSKLNDYEAGDSSTQFHKIHTVTSTIPNTWSKLFYSSKQLIPDWSESSEGKSSYSFDYYTSGKHLDTKFTFHIHKNFLANFLMDLFYEIHRSNLTKGNVPNNKSLFFIHSRSDIIWLEVRRKNSVIEYTSGYNKLSEIDNPIIESYYDKWFNGLKLLNKPINVAFQDTTFWGISQPMYFNKQIPFYVGIATIENSLIPYFHTTNNYLFYTFTTLSCIGLLLSIGYAIKFYQHRLAQRKIKINEERLRLSLEGSNEGVFDVFFEDNHELIVRKSHFSPHNNTILGLNPIEFVSYNEWLNRIHAEHRRSYVETLQHSLEHLKEYEIEYQIRNGKGDYVWILSKGKMLKQANSDLIRHVGTNTNIDEKKKITMEKSLIQKKISRLFNNIPGMSYQCLNDKNWTMSFMSDQCIDITGYDRKEIMEGNPTYNEVIHENYREYVWAEVQKSIQEKNQFRIQYPIIKKDKETAWVLELGTPVFNNEGSLESLEGVIVDVTQSVKSEELVRNSIIKTETFERQRISKELHDGLGQNLSVISINMKELSKEKNLFSDEGRTLFENAIKTLNDSISETRRIAHSLLPKSLDDFGLIVAIEAMIDKIRDSKIFDIGFFTNINEEQRIDQSLEVAIYRIIQEALNNIIKHANADMVEIQLMNNKKVTFLSIEDNGSGYDPKLISEQESSFGLDSMKNRVHSLQGFINIDSSIGKGTLITIEIPNK